MTAPDTSPEAPRSGGSSGGGGEDRLCAYRGCRAPLPGPTGRPGNRPKYCQDGKVWGSSELTCKQAEAAYVAVESLQGDTRVTPQSLQQLGEQLDELADPLTRLLAAVAATAAQLDEEVLTAYADRDAARAQSAADRGAREIAQQDAAQARADAEQARAATAGADAERAAAIRARADADTAAQAAERAQLRAEGQVAAFEERLRRAEQLAEESGALAGQLQVDLAERTATQHAAEQALAAERDRARELDRAHRAELHDRDTALAVAGADHQRRLDQLRGEHQQATDTLTAAHENRLAAERAGHARALQAAHADREAALMQLATSHAAELGPLRERLGAAEQQLTQFRAEMPEDVPPDVS